MKLFEQQELYDYRADLIAAQWMDVEAEDMCPDWFQLSYSSSVSHPMNIETHLYSKWSTHLSYPCIRFLAMTYVWGNAVDMLVIEANSGDGADYESVFDSFSVTSFYCTVSDRCTVRDHSCSRIRHLQFD